MRNTPEIPSNLRMWINLLWELAVLLLLLKYVFK
jgi:hypothetical protein